MIVFIRSLPPSPIPAASSSAIRGHRHLAIRFDLLQPASARLGDQLRIVEHDMQGPGDIGIDGDRGRDILVEFGRINLDVDHVGILGVLIELAGDPVVKAHAEADNQVGIHDRPVGLDGAVHPHHAEAQGVIDRHR